MYDRGLALSALGQMLHQADVVVERTAAVEDIDGFLASPSGMVLLDAVCMNLIALGEATKNLDKVTSGQLLPRYTEVRWEGVMRMRDKIAHHYFEVDAEVVLLTAKEDVPKIKRVIEKMIDDLNENNNS